VRRSARIVGILLLVLAAVAPVSIDTFEPKSAPIPSASIIFGGDMMFDRYIRQVSDVVGGDYPFSCIDSVIRNADLVVANLEGPITDHPPSSVPLTFTFPPGTAALLARHNITIVNLGNNHTLNFGGEGLVQTKRYLTTAEVGFFDESNVATTTVNGISLAFINYNEFAPSPQHSHILKNVGMLRAQGYVPVVYTHWGEEYEPATDKEKELARQFIDAGAEIIVGSHPHIVQEHEVYHGKHIYYSLGNFIFDQYFSSAVTHGLLIKMQFAPTGVTGVEEIPIVLNRDGRVCRI
jgi:poly-gamma-glutamate synthesis protein (capsule biosynthesis protein)